jgi:hypothetical protein
MHTNRTRPLHVIIGLSVIVLLLEATVAIQRQLPEQWLIPTSVPLGVISLVILGWLGGWRP